MAKSDTEQPQVRNCGTMEVHERLLREDPEYTLARAASETAAWEYARGDRSGTRTGVTVIPVVVHVVWNTAAQNISDAQITSQIAVLNQDFRKTNTDVGSTPTVFQPLCADARIEFVLASTDPSGNPTDGIIRTKTTKASFSQDNGVKASSTGGSDAWPADKYLNIWVCQLSGGLLGYAQFPGGPAATDGVVIRHSAFGTTGTAAAPFNLGRTAVHEIGHWLNLRHIWGDDGTGCSGDDFVADTPNCAGPNTGVPTFPHVTCSNGPDGDLFMNYMDYTDDSGMFMFTNGQVNRMQACLDTDRASIGYTKAGPTLAFADIKPTLAVLDVKPTLARFDLKPTLAQLDLKPTLAVLDVKPTAAVLDLQPTAPSLDTPPTLAQLDAGPTAARLDLQPTAAQLDLAPTIGAADIPPGGPELPEGPGPMPFVLATPHHTNAWIESHKALRDQQIETLAAEAEQLEQALTQFAQTSSEGRLSATEAASADQVYAEYTRIMAELDDLDAFDG